MVDMPPTLSHLSMLQCINLTFELKWLHRWWKASMCLIALVYAFCSLEPEGESRAVGAGEERMGVKVLEDCVIKAHKTASLRGSRKVCCWFSPSPPCWPPVKGFISQVSGGCLPSSGNLLLLLAQKEASRREGEERSYLLYGKKT